MAMTEQTILTYGHPVGTRHYHGWGPYYRSVDRPDEEVRVDVRHTLQDDGWVDANRINVDVNEGTVILTGHVHSMVEKRTAGDDAWDTPGVKNVYNNIDLI